MEERSEPPPEDVSLVAGVLRGDDVSIERFTRRMMCVPRILAALNARHGRPLGEDDLSDLTQDTLIVIWSKLDQYREGSCLEGWVYHICFFELMNSLRKKRRHDRLLDDVATELRALDRRALPADPAEFEDLYAGLETLAPKDAAVVRCKHFDELTFEGIGRRLGISANTAKTRYYRGLDLLGQFLNAREEIADERKALR